MEIICCDIAEVEIIQKEKLIQLVVSQISISFLKKQGILPTYLTGTYHKNLGFIYVHVDKKVTFWHVHTKKFICLGTWISLGRVNGDIHRRVSTITKVNMAMCGAQYVTLHIKIG